MFLTFFISFLLIFFILYLFCSYLIYTNFFYIKAFFFVFLISLFLIMVAGAYFVFSAYTPAPMTTYSFDFYFNEPILIIYPFFFTLGLVLCISLLLSLSYNRLEFFYFIIFLTLIFIASCGLFITSSFLSFLFFYELLVLPSVFILYFFSKTRKNIEATYLMFFWTQFGVIFLLFAFFYIYLTTYVTTLTASNVFILKLSAFDCYFLFIMFFIGFGVKFPVWPFYDWLPKAHVEASTNFSIFLSGALVKLAFLGFVRVLYSLFFSFDLLFIVPVLVVGLVKSGISLFTQIDLKKIIAFLTITEMHWLTLSFVFGNTFIWFSSFLMLISHALVSTSFFFLVDVITRRFKTRLVTEISGLFYMLPLLYTIIIANLVVVLGFPGTSLFLSEFLFFLSIADCNFFLLAFLLFFTHFVVLSIFFKHWFTISFGFSACFLYFSNIYDLKLFELFLLSSLLVGLVLLCVSNSIFWIL